MNHLIVIASLSLGIAAGSIACACSKTEPPQSRDSAQQKGDGNNPAKATKMKITIGSRSFTATLYDNPTVTAFKAMLPLTLDMSDLNGNEKFFHFSTNLPTDASNPGTIQAGDLMLWNANSLVLFYKTFPTFYSYTKLGRIENPSELSSAVGSGKVKVRFELE